MKWLSQLVDSASNFFAHRKGLLPLIGIVLVIVNYMLLLIFGPYNFITGTNLLLHLGIITAIFGILLAKAL